MIKNERQYRITKAQAQRFTEAIARSENVSPEGMHPLLRKATLDAHRSQLKDLESQIVQYETLRLGHLPLVRVESFEELPAALISARIAAGLSQKDLADRLGMKEQQIQRYEATNYSGASFSRLSQVVKALGITVQDAVFVPTEQLSLNTFLARLESLGLNREFVRRRIFPDDVNPDIADEHGFKLGEAILRAASSLRRLFGWSIAEVLGAEQPMLDFAVAGAARFKLPARVSDRRLNTYTVYAHHLSWLSLAATESMPVQSIPRDPSEVIRAIQTHHGKLSFRTALDYVWSLGIVVLPLDDEGAFHGACWRIKGRNVIVLKQRTCSEARWLFDLLHELWHASEEPELQERTTLELPESDDDRRNAAEEKHASRFAGNVVLSGRAEELVDMVVQETGGIIPKFKAALPRIARREGVSADSFANYMAFRLSLQRENWWGTANNLQPAGNPWSIARDAFLLRCDFSALDETDRGLLTRALEESNEEAA
jgi:transcriptional regulator with XRE-family HTH domain/Zn-dependent peptidase ImmA (M78 family)